MIQKTARKPSQDPAQEKLRQHKADWNKEVSSFINDLIHFKKMMNGWPSKYFQQRSKIIVPIPANTSSIVSQLAGKFQELAQESTSIAQEQDTYSKNRRVSRPQQATNTLNKLDETHGPTSTTQYPNPLETPPSPDVSRMLGAEAQNDLIKLASSLEEKYLVSEGSNSLTRFFARLLNPAIGTDEGARIRRYRMSLLTAVVNAYRDLGRFQADVVGSSPESIFTASKVLNKIENEWKFVSAGFSTFQMTMPKGAPNAGGPIAPPQDIVEDRNKEQAKPVAPTAPSGFDPSTIPDPNGMSDDQIIALTRRYVSDYSTYLGPDKLGAMNLPSIAQFRQLAGDFLMSKGDVRGQLARQLAELYQDILQNYNKAYGTTGYSLEQVYAAVVNRNNQQKSQEKEQNAQRKEQEKEEAKVQKEREKAQAKQQADFNKQKEQMGSWSSADQIEKVAQDFLKRWTGKAYHSLNPLDKTSAFRLDAYKFAQECRNSLNKVMNSLEKEMNIERLEPFINEITNKLFAMRSLMRALESTNRGKGFQEPFVDLLEKGRITDHAPNLTPEQKKSLEKSLQHRQMRELTNFYGKK